MNSAGVPAGVSRPEKGAIRDQWMAVAREALAGERSPHLPGDKKFSWTIAPHDGHPSELKVIRFSEAIFRTEGVVCQEQQLFSPGLQPIRGHLPHQHARNARIQIATRASGRVNRLQVCVSGAPCDRGTAEEGN